MRFSWTALILAPLLVPMMFSLAMLSPSGASNPVLGFLITMLLGGIVSYIATILLFLPSLYLLSLWRPATGPGVCMLGFLLGAAVAVPLTWLAWAGSGPDSGPPTESFPTFLLHSAADPFNAICPMAGLVTAACYWWLATRRGRPAPQ